MFDFLLEALKNPLPLLIVWVAVPVVILIITLILLIKKKAKALRIFLWIVLFLLFAANAVLGYLTVTHPDAKNVLAASHYAAVLSDETPLALDGSITVRAGGIDLTLPVSVDRVSTAGRTVTVITAENRTFYLADNTLILESGAAHKVGDASLTSKQILTAVSGLLITASSTAEDAEGTTVYTVNIPEQGLRMIESAAGSQSLLSDLSLSEAVLSLSVRENAVTALSVDGSGLVGSEPAVLSLALTVTDRETTLPDAVRATAEGSETGTTVLRDRVSVLSDAILSFSQSCPVAADLTIGVDLGILPVELTYRYAKVKTGSLTIASLASESGIVYSANGKTCDENGNKNIDTTGLFMSPETTVAILPLLLDSVLSEDAVFTESGTALTCDIVLSEEALSALIPALEGLDLGGTAVTLKDASVNVATENGELCGITLSATATVTILVTLDVPLTMTIVPDTVTTDELLIPAAVVEALQ